MSFVLLNQRNRGRKEKWKQKCNNNRRPWQLCAATMRKSKHNLKPAGSSVNRGRLNCKKNDEKRKKRSRRPKLLIPTTLGYNLVLIINQNNAKTGFSQCSELLLATQSIASFVAVFRLVPPHKRQEATQSNTEMIVSNKTNVLFCLILLFITYYVWISVW